jgi:bacterioferritin (cytochrome b1)
MSTQATWIEQQPFLVDVEGIHWTALRELKQATSANGHPGSDTLIQLLSQIQLMELALTFRNLYKSRAAARKQSSNVADRLMEHAIEKQTHAEAASARIATLGGENIWNANGLPPTSHLSRLQGVSLADMVRESLLAETFLADLCRKSVELLEENDPQTRSLIEQILAAEERQISELTTLLDQVSSSKKPDTQAQLGDSQDADRSEESWDALFAGSHSTAWFKEILSKRASEE